MWRSALAYAVAWTVAAFVGAGVAGYGVVRWLLPAYARYQGGDPTGAVLQAAAPGLALAFVGVLLWKVTGAVVRYRTLTATTAAETAAQLNTEAMKSDILSVLDERLADMKQDTQRTRRLAERLGSEDAADEFDFPEG